MFTSRFASQEVTRLGWISAAFCATLLLAGLAEYLPPQADAARVYQALHINMSRLCVIVDVLIFSLAWNAFDRARRAANVLLALTFLAAAVFDFLYVTRLPGLPTPFPHINPDDALYFWLLGRFVTTSGLLAVVRMPPCSAMTRRCSHVLLLLFCAAILLCSTIIIEDWPWLPDLPGQAGHLKHADGALCLLLLCLALSRWRPKQAEAEQPAPGSVVRVDLYAAGMALFVSGVFFNFLQFDSLLQLAGPLFNLIAVLLIFRSVLVGSIKAPYAALTDLTGRLQHASAALRQSELHLSGIIDHANDAIMTINDRGFVMLANPAAAAMFGCSSETMCGSLFTRFVPPQHRQNYLARAQQLTNDNYARSALGRSFRGCDVAGRRAGGEEFPLEATLSIMPDGARWLIILILRDSTERRRHQQALAASNEELRRLSQALQEVRENERKRIVRGLHDDLGQLLATLRIDLSLLQKQARQARVRPDQLDTMGALVSNSINSLRRIASDLRPRALDEGGLYFALQNLCKDFASRHGIRCELIASEAEIALDEHRTTTLYRIVQEALAEVFRHPGAREVLVVLERRGNDLLLRIEDDGRGMPDDLFRKAVTVGLIDMRERVRSLGGELAIAAQQEGGTRFDILIPLDGDSAPAAGDLAAGEPTARPAVESTTSKKL